MSREEVADSDRRIVVGITIASSQIPALAPGVGCKLEFDASRVVFLALFQGGGYRAVKSVSYAEVDSLTVGGRGAETRTTGGQVVGGGFGVQGALEGMALAALLNSRSSKTTTTVDTTLYLKAGTTELLMQNSTITPQVLQVRLSPTFARIEEGQRNRMKPASSSVPPSNATISPAPTSLIDELRKLADLHESGALTDSEFAALKQRLMNV